MELSTDTTTVILNGRPVTSFAEGDYITATFINELTSRVNGGDNSVTVGKRADGNVLDVVLRVVKFGSDDVVFNSAINQKKPVVFNGSMKQPFTKDGVDGVETYIMENGTITTRPVDTKNNQDGNAMMEYTFQFRNASRNL